MKGWFNHCTGSKFWRPELPSSEALKILPLAQDKHKKSPNTNTRTNNTRNPKNGACIISELHGEWMLKNVARRDQGLIVISRWTEWSAGRHIYWSNRTSLGTLETKSSQMWGANGGRTTRKCNAALSEEWWRQQKEVPRTGRSNSIRRLREIDWWQPKTDAKEDRTLF